MKTPRRSGKINKSRLVENFAAIKEISFVQNPAAPLQFDLSPIIGCLKYHLAVGLCLQLDNHETPVSSERKQVDLVVGRAKLIIDRRRESDWRRAV